MEHHFVPALVALSVFVCSVYAIIEHYDAKTSAFLRIIGLPAFVDKSLLLKEIFTENKYKMILAPRKFGKTANLEMMKHFASIQVNSDGVVIDRLYTHDHQIFVNLNIRNDSLFFYSNLGAFATIHLNLTRDTPITSFNESLCFVRERVHLAYMEHNYLCKSWNLNELQREKCRLWIDPVMYKTCESVQDGLLLLGRYLRNHFRKKLLLLVDGYDSVITSAMFHVNKVDLDKIISLVTGLINDISLKHFNPDLVVITGVTHVQGPTESSLGYFRCYRFLESHPLSEYYGFTERDVDQLFDDFSLQWAREKRDEFKCWYNGFINRRGVRLYNPYSVQQFFEKKTIGAYWTDTGYVYELKKICRQKPLKMQFKRLLESESVCVEVTDIVKAEDLHGLDLTYANVTGRKTDILFSLLADYGYLTRFVNGSSTAVRITNTDMKTFLVKEIFVKESDFDRYYNDFLESVKKCCEYSNKLLKPVRKYCELSFEYLKKIFAYL